MGKKNIKICKQKDELLNMICEVENLYEKDFKEWEECYKDLVKAVFDKDDIKKTYKRKKTDDLKWLNNKFIEKYPMFKYLLEFESNVFSFIVMLNKYGETSRLDIANTILDNKKENNKCQTRFTGVPGGQQGVSFDTFEKIKDKDKKLNQIAYKLINDLDNIQDDDIDTNLSNTFKNVYYILAPQKFYPSDSNTRAILKKLGKLNTDVKEPIKLSLVNDEGEFFTRAVSFTARLEQNQVENILNKFIDDKNNKKPKNIILTGIPGTGKTYAITEYLEKNGNDKNDENNLGGYEFVQFHPSYDYEDFIEGFKPIAPKGGQIEFKLVDGIFKKLCKKAYKNLNSKEETKTYVMVIDEINRANLSRVFGELLYCLEYRDEFVSTKMTTYIELLDEEKGKKEHSVDENNIGKFAIPSNVLILGTMNEVDRSIDAFDLALRRRFIWEEVGFSETALRLYPEFLTNNFQNHIEDLVKKAKDLNKKLTEDIGINYQLGHTYYFKIIDYFTGDFDSALCDLWEYHIKSIVKEYIKVKFPENEIKNKLAEFKKIIVEDKNSCNG